MTVVLNSKTNIPSKALIGGKAYGLHELANTLDNVPIWGTLTTLFFDELISDDPKFDKLLKKQDGEGLFNFFKSISFSNAQQNLLKDLWNTISKNGSIPVAVRSSAIDEDGDTLSFAGQMDSFLHIISFDTYLEAIRGCLASLYGERAIVYRKQNGLDPFKAKIAVVVQQMIPAEISGILFSANPTNNNLNEMLITSAYGLGEGLVSGILDTDSFVLNQNGEILSEELATKDQQLLIKKDGGVTLEKTCSKKINQSSLSMTQLETLHKLALTASKKKGCPLDIEFSIYEDQIYFLQARPITSLKQKENVKIWDNSNIVESYSGVTTPLTFSFIQKAYFAVYCQFCKTIGVSQKETFKNRHILENMLGLINGRVYYNLINWYKLVSLMPGFEYNKEFMEQMMGLQTIPEDTTIKTKTKWTKYFVELPRLLFVGIKMAFAHIRLPRKIKSFQRNFNKLYAHYSSIDFDKKSPTELMTFYRELEEKILWNWRSPITNDFEAMIFYGLLKKFTVKWDVDPDGILQNDLLSGEGNIHSTDLIAALGAIALEIEKDAVLKEKFLAHEADKTFDMLKSDSEFISINNMFSEYLKKYGVRCINEMKLESTPIKDDPLFCISAIQSYLRNGSPDPQKQQQEKDIRQQAEQTLTSRLEGKRYWIYRWILKHARAAIKNRENQRFARTQGYDLVRSIFRSIGKTWEKKTIIDEREDIFYLKIDEVFSFIEGTSTLVNLKKLIELRKEEFLNFETLNPDDHIETEGEVYFNNSFTQPVYEDNSSVIEGLGCCSGIIKAKIKVVLSPDKNLKLNKEIMVAKQTDPGWGILFPSVSGLIIEKGSMLSHSAIVAREMGIPAVIGVKNATKRLKDGDLVILDGAKGTIQIVEKTK